MLKIRDITTIFVLLLLVVACEEKSEPIIRKSNIDKPISCLKLDIVDNNELVKHLQKKYNFQDSCNYTLSLKFKKDIVCNSTYNVGMKSMGKFPKSFLQLEVRDGLTPLYSYYIDLYHNANSDDIDRGFERLKRDVLLSN